LKASSSSCSRRPEPWSARCCRAGRSGWINVERTRDAQHGDYASNIALRLAPAAPQAAARAGRGDRRGAAGKPAAARAEVAGAGFINFHLAAARRAAVLRAGARAGERLRRSEIGAGERVLLEFVSANPTGPLHVGHGRQAAYGATLGNLLRATGHDVQREYYINDAGRQMDILAVSTWLRYLERCGEPAAVPLQRLSRRLRASHRRAALEAHSGRELRRRAAGVRRAAAGCAGGRQGASTSMR
jgi:arginyl-tRNA synthetase